MNMLLLKEHHDQGARMNTQPDMYKTLLQSLPDIVYEIDHKGNFLYLNDAVERLGYDRGALLGCHFSSIIHPDDLQDIQRATVLPQFMGRETGADGAPGLFDERRNGKRITKNLRLRLKAAPGISPDTWNGEVISLGLYNFHAASERDFIGTLGIIRDTTWKKKSEEAFLRTEKYYRVLLQNSSELISIIANDGTILYASDSSEKMLRYNSFELIGENIHDYIHSDDTESMRKLLEERKTPEEPDAVITIRFCNRNSAWRFFKTELNKIADDLNETICFVMNSIDVTDRVLAEEAVKENGEKFRAIIEYSSEAIALISRTGEIEYMSHPIERIMGYSPYELAGENTDRYLHPDEIQPLMDRCTARIREGNMFFTEEFRMRHKDGSWHYMEASISCRLGIPPIDGIIVNLKDISEIKSARTALKYSEEKYRMLYDSALVGMASLEADTGTILTVNKMACSMFGYTSKNEFIGETIFGLITNPQILDHIKKQVFSNGFIENEEMMFTRRDGSTFWGSLTARSNPHTGSVHAVINDITRSKTAEDQIYRLTFFDPLTELPNREMFKNRLTVELMRMTNFAIMCIGLDNYKQVNNVYGPAFGDRLLYTVASELNEVYFKNDMVSRLAEDIFIILLSDIGGGDNATNIENIDTIAQKTRSIFARPFLVNNQSIDIVTSIGIAIFPHDGSDAEALIKNAESAMFVARDSGHNRFHYFDRDLNQKMMTRMKLENEIKTAIKKKDFFSHYQPKFDANGVIIGMESLMRWHHRKSGTLIPPTEFIPIAEKNGMIIDLGMFILEESCIQNQLWHADHDPPLRVAVNLSPFQFSHPELIPEIIRRLEKTGLPASLLELEITESGIMENEKDSIGKLRKLHEMGIAISIDDFGTGYSSLSKLKDYPIDTLKIDRTFVIDLPGNTMAATLATTIIDLAHNLGFKVVAEGVETAEQFHFLREHGCEYYQGYLFSRPLSSDDFTARLEEFRKGIKIG